MSFLNVGRRRLAAARSYASALDPIWLAQIGLCVLAVAIVQAVFTLAPVPPGVDPAHWVASSYAWVGLPYPDTASAGSPYAYTPLTFPLLGLTYLAVGRNPLAADFLFCDLVLFFVGLSTVHVARTVLRVRPIVQPAFLASVLFTPPLLKMVFWGAYPNLLAFVFLNEAVVFLVLYLRSLRPSHALGLWGSASLLYLTHTLTFVLFAALFALVIFLMVIFRRRPWIPLTRIANLAGFAMLLATAAVFQATYAAFGIALPGYVAANPGAYLIDNLGEIGLAFGLPAADPWATFGALVAGGFAVLGFLAYRHFRRPRGIDRSVMVTAAWLVAALWIPAGGWAAHVDTDYARFGYLLAPPLALAVALAAERGLAGLEDRLPKTWPSAARGWPQSRFVRWHRDSRGTAAAIGTAAVVVFVAFLVLGIGTPTAYRLEVTSADQAHQSDFLAAMRFLREDPTPGSVLATQPTARWVQALTDRGAYDYGPTWLDFFPWEIDNALASYWAQNTYQVLGNNRVALAYSGFSSVVLAQDPEYAAYVDGVVFPVARLLSSEMWLNVTAGNVSGTVPLSAWGPGHLFAVPANGALLSGYSYRSPWFFFNVTGTVSPVAPTAWINLTFVPIPRAHPVLRSFTLGLASGAAVSRLAHAPTDTQIALAPSPLGTFEWDEMGSLGQLPGLYRVRTFGAFSPAPSAGSVTVNLSAYAPAHLLATFANLHPTPDTPWRLSLRLTTPGASNPAVVFPSWFTVPAWLTARQIRFLLVPNDVSYEPVVEYYEALYGWTLAYANAGWYVLAA